MDDTFMKRIWELRGETCTDGTARLCHKLYGEERPQYYLGGADAKMLHDAADRIEALEAELDQARLDLARMELADVRLEVADCSAAWLAGEGACAPSDPVDAVGTSSKYMISVRAVVEVALPVESFNAAPLAEGDQAPVTSSDIVDAIQDGQWDIVGPDMGYETYRVEASEPVRTCRMCGGTQFDSVASWAEEDPGLCWECGDLANAECGARNAELEDTSAGEGACATSRPATCDLPPTAPEDEPW